MGVIDEILERIDPVEIIGEYVKLERSGKEYRGLCPFHTEKTPSFYVNPNTGLYHCFGCGASGNIFKFIMDIEGVDFKEALRILAKRAGVELTEFKEQKEISVLTKLADYLHNILKNTRNPAIDYLKNKRKLKLREIEIFKLGYYPEGALRSFMQKEGLSSAFMVNLGLLREGRSGFYEVFKGRLIFPIFSETGRVLGFGGRVLDSSHSPKYINSPDSSWYKKGKHLYGFYQAKGQIRETKEVIITEGYMDVIAMHVMGFTNTVASLGTSFTEEHVRLLSKYVEKAFILFDMDEAGKKAAERVVPMLFKWGIVPYMVELEEGKDPAELYETGNTLLISRALENAKDFVEYYLNSAKNEEEKIKTLRKLKAIIALSKDDILKGVFIDRVRKISGVDLKVGVSKKNKKSRKNVLSADLKILLAAAQFDSLRRFIREEFEENLFYDEEARRLVKEIKEGRSFEEVFAFLDEETSRRYVEFLETIDFGEESKKYLEMDLRKKLEKLKKERISSKRASLSEIVRLKKEEMGENEGLDNPE